MEIGERVATLETKTEIALAGVANFKAFQTEARDFFSRYDEREIQRERADKRHTRRLNAIIALGTLVFLAMSAVAAILALHANETRSILQDLSTSQYQYTIAERTNR